MGPPSTWQSTPETQESSLTPPSPLLLNLQLDSRAQIFLQSFHFLHLHYHHPSPSHYYLLPGLFYSVFFLNHPCPSQFHSPDSKHNEFSKMPVCHVRLYKILRWLPTAWKSSKALPDMICVYHSHPELSVSLTLNAIWLVPTHSSGFT